VVRHRRGDLRRRTPTHTAAYTPQREDTTHLSRPRAVTGFGCPPNVSRIMIAIGQLSTDSFRAHGRSHRPSGHPRPAARLPEGGSMRRSGGAITIRAGANGDLEGTRCSRKLGPRLAISRRWDIDDPAHGSIFILLQGPKGAPARGGDALPARVPDRLQPSTTHPPPEQRPPEATPPTGPFSYCYRDEKVVVADGYSLNTARLCLDTNLMCTR